MNIFIEICNQLKKKSKFIYNNVQSELTIFNLTKKLHFKYLIKNV